MVLCPVPYVIAGAWVVRKIPVLSKTPRGRLLLTVVSLALSRLVYALLRRAQRHRQRLALRLPIGLDRRRFGLSEHGFVPHQSDILLRLPPHFRVWEETGDKLPLLLQTRELRPAVDDWPCVDLAPLLDSGEDFSPALRRAYTVLSMVAQAYAWGEDQHSTELPMALAVPLYSVASRIGLLPTLTQAGAELWNCQCGEGCMGDAVQQESMRCAMTMTGTADEEWFYCSSVACQMIAGPAVLAVYDIFAEAVPARDVDAVEDFLDQCAERLARMSGALAFLSEKCSPNAWSILQPLLQGAVGASSAKGVIFTGVPEHRGQLQCFAELNAAQSSAVAVLDAALGVGHEGAAAVFFLEMRRYMPARHRTFVELMHAQRPLRDVLREWSNGDVPGARALVPKFNLCVDRLADFRRVATSAARSPAASGCATDAPQCAVAAGSPLDAFVAGAVTATLAAKI